MMRASSFFLFICFVVIITSCTKEKFIRGENAFLITSDTALHFDTVFTSVGSVTKQLKIFNINDQKLRISNLQLAGGEASSFKMNVSGSPGVQFNNIELDKGDSMYVFVSITGNPTAQQLPFIIEDSIRIDYNGNTQYVKLDAYGQNAHFLRGAVISENTTWTADLPYVLLDTFAVSAGTTLTIEKGVHVYCHANTPFTVDGSLQINGEEDSASRVTFQNDRLDAPYKDQPGTWQGIYFNPGSKNNELNSVTVKNALQGIAADEESSIVLNNCKIDNCAEAGIIAYHSVVTATNCLVTNCSYNIYTIAGGNYTFTNCTMAGYSTRYLYHQYPSVTLSNRNDDGTDNNDLHVLFQNCIVWGEEGIVTDEIATLNDGNSLFDARFENTLYKSPSENQNIVYANCLLNSDPMFTNIDRENGLFDFHLAGFSPCIDAGKKNILITDLDGNERTEIPDIGCYESD